MTFARCSAPTLARHFVVALPFMLTGCGAASSPTLPTPAVVRQPAVLPTARFAATPPPVPAFDDPERAKKITDLVATLDERVDGFFAKHKPPSLAVAMVADGRIVFSRVLGVRDKASKTPATEHTMFRIGSVTKTFTASLVLSLRDEGRLRLDDAAETYLPELAWVEYPFKDAPRITIRHLLTHTSGLPRLGDFDYTRATDVRLDEMLDALHRAKLEQAPGTRYEYSNFGMSLLGEIVARVAPEKSLRAALAKRVTEPLGMTRTAFDPKAVRDAELATGYASNDDDTPASLWHLGASEAAGGIWSTVPDMARWIAAQLEAWPPRDAPESALMKRASLREAHQPAFSIGLHAGAEKDQVQATSSAIGLAWHTQETCAYERIVWHNGGVDGFSSDIGFAPERGFGFVVLASALNTPTGELKRALFDAAASVLGPRKAQPAPETKAVIEKLAAAFGTCSEADYGELLTKSFRSVLPFDAFRSVCQTYAKAHGACRLAKTVALTSPYAGTFTLACERGAIEAEAVVNDEEGHGRLSGLLVRQTGLVPSPDVVRAARQALLLQGRWDAGRYSAIFAANVEQRRIKDGIEKVRADAGTCRLAADAEKHGGDGERGAALDIDCEKGAPSELLLKLDGQGKIESIRFQPRPEGAERANERCTGSVPPKPAKK